MGIGMLQRVVVLGGRHGQNGEMRRGNDGVYHLEGLEDGKGVCMLVLRALH